MKATLIVFLKQPVAGRVKTRLGRTVGMTVAAWWFRHQTARLLRAVARDRRWTVVLSVDPAGAVGSRIWPRDLARCAQGPGDLGQRMARALMAAPRGPVVLIGADIPDVRPGMIARAFRCLGQNDAVLGPATDGGFWLVGLNTARRVPPGLFKGVRWSTGHAMADTIATMTGLRIGEAETLPDVDTQADLRPAALATRLT